MTVSAYLLVQTDVGKAAQVAEEIRAIDPDATQRMDDLDLLTDRGLRARIDAAGATLIGFREIRDLQRARR